MSGTSWKPFEKLNEKQKSNALLEIPFSGRSFGHDFNKNRAF